MTFRGFRGSVRERKRHLPFIGIMDLYTALDSRRTIMDFKTASSGYEDYEVALPSAPFRDGRPVERRQALG